METDINAKLSQSYNFDCFVRPQPNFAPETQLAIAHASFLLATSLSN